jgi:hypothetical protein
MQGEKDRWGILLPGAKIEKVRFHVHFLVAALVVAVPSRHALPF